MLGQTTIKAMPPIGRFDTLFKSQLYFLRIL